MTALLQTLFGTRPGSDKASDHVRVKITGSGIISVNSHDLVRSERFRHMVKQAQRITARVAQHKRTERSAP